MDRSRHAREQSIVPQLYEVKNQSRWQNQAAAAAIITVLNSGLGTWVVTTSFCSKQVVLHFRMTDRLFFAAPITRPEDIIPYLAKQERHWKKGYSAYELACSWVGAKGIPDQVGAILHQAEEFRGMELIEGFFEKETDLRSRGRPSQTDLLALIGDGEGFAVLGVEGKVDEPFGSLVSEWLVDASANKQARLSVLQGTLGLAGHNIRLPDLC